jgi:hypothetical protein
VHQRLRFALALGLRAACPFDVRARAIVMSIEKEDAGPEIDRFVVVVGEISIETGEQQLLDPRITISASERVGCGSVGSSRIHR